jgi:hypothetical protein
MGYNAVNTITGKKTSSSHFSSRERKMVRRSEESGRKDAVFLAEECGNAYANSTCKENAFAEEDA